MERRVLPLIPSGLECISCHFSLWAHWKIICVCLGLDLSSAGAAAHSRDVSVGYRQEGPGQHQPACPDESNQIPLPPAPPSSRLTQPALLPTAGLNTGQLSGRQLWFAFKQQQIPFSPAFFYLPVSSAHLFFLPPIVPLVPAALPFYPSTAKPQGTSSMGPLDPSQPAGSLWGGWLFGGFV